jgi:hypothetical protein
MRTDDTTEVVGPTTSTWDDLAHDCPLWLVESLDDLDPAVTARMSVRRRSNQDEIVIDLRARTRTIDPVGLTWRSRQGG